jgi:TonB family protein
MKKLLFFFILLGYHAVSQTVYQAHEVEQQVVPSGGILLLNQFIASNIQVPLRSSVQGIKAKVFVKGIVETDGTMTGLEVVKGIDSLCDKEALRVLGLYKAWKPAVLQGRKVRQTAFTHVMFEAPAKEDFDTTRWSLVPYYDEKMVRTTDPARYRYRSVIHLDDQGNYDKDLVYEELRNGKWKQTSSVPFKRRELWYKVQGEPGVDSVRAYEISAQDNYEMNHVPFITFQQNGKRLSYVQYLTMGKVLLRKDYYLSGMLKETESFADSSSIRVSYYDNGMLKSVVESPLSDPEHYQESRIVHAWNRDGKQVVKDGNGFWKFVTTTVEGGQSLLVEEGALTDGYKAGKWVGKLADSTVYYTELYENRKLKEGISFVNGEKINYTERVLQPKFKGGQQEFYKFLGQNMKYPAEASRRRISGRVYISFVVCEDGSLCDYKLEKSVQKDIDQEALRVVKKMSGKWEPGEIRGQKVRVKYNLPVNFKFL